MDRQDEEGILLVTEEGTHLDAAEEAAVILTQTEMTVKAHDAIVIVGEAVERMMT